jgi:hypothetical protein
MDNDKYGLKAASQCDTLIREYCRGVRWAMQRIRPPPAGPPHNGAQHSRRPVISRRPNAKKALKQIAKQTGSALPRRYLVSVAVPVDATAAASTAMLGCLSRSVAAAGSADIP